MPEASAAAAPPLEPPGVSFGFHGLRVIPASGLSVAPFQPNSAVLVLPRMTAPASRRRATPGASSSHGPSGSINFDPRKVGQPRVSSRSLIDSGTPSNGLNGDFACQRRSDSAAAPSADSSSTRRNALSSPSCAAIAAKAARTAAIGESSPEPYNADSSAAPKYSISVLIAACLTC